jgi:hypothetical protein
VKAAPVTCHAVALGVAVDADGPLAGVLLLGPSGAGKSSLALAVIDSCPFRRSAMIADDAVIVSVAENGRLAARAPATIRGLIEVRGFGPAPVRSIGECGLVAAFDLGAAAERTPVPGAWDVAGGRPLPLYPFLWRGAELTAPARLRASTASIMGGQTAERTQDSVPNRRIEDR